jgi:dihydropyrimidinase
MVHLSAKEALQKVREARDRGLPIHGETCPHYLSLHYEEMERPQFEGAKFVCSPPLRRRENTPRLWNGLREENLQEISSDHCAFNWKVQKELGRESFANIPNGIAGIETMIPIVHSEGVRGGHLSINQMVNVTATNSARLFGLYPEKGTIAVGSDADLVVFDPDRKVTVTRELLHQNVDHTPYEGFAVTGWPAVTISRGEASSRTARSWAGRDADGSSSGRRRGACSVATGASAADTRSRRSSRSSARGARAIPPAPPPP